MLAKLMSELESFPGSFPGRRSLPGPSSVSTNICLWNGVWGSLRCCDSLKSDFVILCDLVDRGDRGSLLKDLWDLFLAPQARCGPSTPCQAPAGLKSPPFFFGHTAYHVRS